MFSSFVSIKLVFASMSLLQTELQFDSADKPDYPIPRLNYRQHCQFHYRFGGFGGEIVAVVSHVVLPCVLAGLGVVSPLPRLGRLLLSRA